MPCEGPPLRGPSPSPPTPHPGGERGERRESPMGRRNGFWQDRRVFVTGATGLVGGWTVRALVARGAHVVALVRDRVAGCELRRLRSRIDIVSGCVTDAPLLERALNEYEVQTVFHLAAQTIVGTAAR